MSLPSGDLAKGYTKHYYAGSERVASRVVERWFVNAKADSLHSVEEHHIKDALQMSNWQFDFTLGERPSYMNSYMPDSVSDIMGNTMQNKVRFPVLALAGYFKRESLVGEACEDLRGREGANGLFFTHSDHLGSSSWTTDADGRAVQHTEYLPFGEELLNQRATFYSERYTFTGKELDEESNLYYYDARYNSSTYSQFTTVDPMSDKYPSVNPYLYCAGNPIKYIDPTGKDTFNFNEDTKRFTLVGKSDGDYDVIAYSSSCNGIIKSRYGREVRHGLLHDNLSVNKYQTHFLKDGITEQDILNYAVVLSDLLQVEISGIKFQSSIGGAIAIVIDPVTKSSTRTQSLRNHDDYKCLLSAGHGPILMDWHIHPAGVANPLIPSIEDCDHYDELFKIAPEVDCTILEPELETNTNATDKYYKEAHHVYKNR